MNKVVNGWVYTPYVVRGGKKIYPKKAKVFKFPARRP